MDPCFEFPAKQFPIPHGLLIIILHNLIYGQTAVNHGSGALWHSHHTMTSWSDIGAEVFIVVLLSCSGCIISVCPCEGSPWSESDLSEDSVEPVLSMRVLSTPSCSRRLLRCLCSRCSCSTVCWALLSLSSNLCRVGEGGNATRMVVKKRCCVFSQYLIKDSSVTQTHNSNTLDRHRAQQITHLDMISGLHQQAEGGVPISIWS